MSKVDNNRGQTLGAQAQEQSFADSFEMLLASVSDRGMKYRRCLITILKRLSENDSDGMIIPL